MTLGPIEAVRVFTTKLAVARRFYAETLGLPEILAADATSSRLSSIPDAGFSPGAA
jgi:hypothetical protein